MEGSRRKNQAEKKHTQQQKKQTLAEHTPRWFLIFQKRSRTFLLLSSAAPFSTTPRRKDEWNQWN